MSRAALALFALMLLVSASCEFVVGAAAGAGAMYALGEDSTEQFFDAPMPQAHAAALAELTARGEVRRDDPGAKEGVIEASVEGSKITVSLHVMTGSTTRIVVTARKWGSLAPDLDGAQMLADRIARRLSE